MKLTNPNGLWLLLGIPLLIIIYLIKSAHEDRPQSSTYLWQLSRKLSKKRAPRQRWRKILLFLLQLLMIAAVAIIAAKPVVTKGECFDFVAIIDASAGMQMENEKGVSRFDRAVSQVEALAKKLSDGHTLSVILAGDIPTCLVQGADNAENVKVALENAVCTDGVCDIQSAVLMAQKICDRSENAKVMLYTDRTPVQAGNIHVVNLSENEQNITVESLEAQNVSKDLVFTGKVRAYPSNDTVTVGLRVDGKTVDAKKIECINHESTEVKFTLTGKSDFETAELYIEKKDALAADNSFAICRKNSKKHRVLLVSASPLYLESALKVFGNCEVTTIASLEGAELSGMDLYIFDGMIPEEYPTDGSVVVFGTEHLPDGLRVGAVYEDQCKLMMENAAHPICVDMLLGSAVVKGYTDLVGNSLWEEVLYCDDSVVMAVSERENGTRVSVFSFDIHNSNLPLQQDFVILMRNLVEYSIPGLVSKTEYTVSDTVKINVTASMDELYLKHPDGSVQSLYTGQDGCAVAVNHVGIYTIVMQNASGGAYADFFVRLPETEPYDDTETVINIALTEKKEETKKEAVSGIWFYIALAVLVVVLIEWEWYYYEQY